MSVDSWQEEYCTEVEAAARESEIAAITHSLKKWKGLRMVNLQDHFVVASGSELKDPAGVKFNVTSQSCALCVRHTVNGAIKCKLCSITKTIGVPCDRVQQFGEFGNHPLPPWQMFIRFENPEPMIQTLLQTLEREKRIEIENTKKEIAGDKQEEDDDDNLCSRPFHIKRPKPKHASNKVYHVMIDLETLGTQLDTVILQIGAVGFNVAPVEWSIGSNTYVDIDSQIQKQHRSVTTDTLAWWQDDENKIQKWKQILAAKSIARNLRSSLLRLSLWFHTNIQKEALVWSHGATFDIAILIHAYEQCGLQVPWGGKMVRDTRTWFDSAGQSDAIKNILTGDAEGHHDAVQDARRQAEAVICAYQIHKNMRDSAINWVNNQAVNATKNQRVRCKSLFI